MAFVIETKHCTVVYGVRMRHIMRASVCECVYVCVQERESFCVHCACVALCACITMYVCDKIALAALLVSSLYNAVKVADFLIPSVR